MSDRDTGASAAEEASDAVTPLDSNGSLWGMDPDDRLTYDEIDVGDRFAADRSVTFTTEAIIDFAEKYDPQPFHVSDEADEASPFDGLVASGLHSYCACNRLAVEAFFGRIAFLGGSGVDEMRWYRPVHPGDTLTVEVEIADKRVSESDPRRGYIDIDITGHTEDGDPVVNWRVLGMVRREPQD
ncbi:MAG: MaoC/PaaZ C-terminal domain-containing protein [Haloquadratum sp.]